MYEIIKKLLALMMLIISAYTDLRERNIYVLPLLVGVVASVSVIVASIAFGTEHSMEKADLELSQIIMKQLIIPLLFSMLVFVIVLLSNGQIGIGDAFLLSSLSLSTGVLLEIRIILISVCLSGLFSIYLLSIRGKSLRDGIPFAPFMLIAYISVFCVRVLIMGKGISGL